MKTDIELISIGSELLSGRTLNSHAQTLGAALTAIGLRLSRDTTIPDEIETIQFAVREAFERTDIVVVSGGLGPTSDDITRDALAGLFGRKIVISSAALAALHKRFNERGRIINPAAERQALILDGAETLINSAGAAPGERLGFPGNKTLFILPGPPNEFAAVLNDHIVPWLIKQFPDVVPLELRVLTTQGIGESDIVTRLEEAGFQPLETSIGFYPGLGKVEIRLTAPREQFAALEAVERTLRAILRDKLIGK
ncbi:MAG: molybdopterin-binding protein [Kiritimatiellales bacterium]